MTKQEQIDELKRENIRINDLFDQLGEAALRQMSSYFNYRLESNEQIDALKKEVKVLRRQSDDKDLEILKLKQQLDDEGWQEYWWKGSEAHQDEETGEWYIKLKKK